MTNLCHTLFGNKNYLFLFDNVMEIYKLLLPNLQQRINNLVELISDIKDPHLKISTQAVTDSAGRMGTPEPNEDEFFDANESSSETPVPDLSKLTPRELQLRISELKFQRFQLKDAFDNLYKEIKNVDKLVDLNKLSELRTQIKECEDKIVQLTSYLNGDMLQQQNSVNATPVAARDEVAAVTSIENDPVECTLHCLNIAICLLQDPSLKAITPQLRSLFDSLIIANIGSVNEQIRINAVKALNLICILKLEIAQKYVPLLLEMIQHDMKEVVIEAFKAMINCIMAYSIKRLANLDAGDTSSNNLNTTNQGGTSDPQQIAERTTKILNVMTSLLDNDDPEIYTTAVEGFCKLYMTGHIVSAKLLSKLLIMYYSPITENDIKLRACLSAFLPQFSFFRASNQLCMEESFMLTLKCLINAPPDSYLSEIDLSKVMEVLFNLTNPKNLMQRRAPNQRLIQHNNICHENIVKSICYEILKDENAYKCKTYMKVLQMADLTGADYLSLKSIHELTDEVHLHIQDKLVKKSAVKFNEMVYGLMIKKPEYEKEKKQVDLQFRKI